MGLEDKGGMVWGLFDFCLLFLGFECVGGRGGEVGGEVRVGGEWG